MFQALSESGASSDLLIQAINRYVDYGLTTSYGGNSDSEVRYQALKAAKPLYRNRPLRQYQACYIAKEKLSI